LLNEEKINEAYDLMFAKIKIEGEEEATLVRLMSWTGVCYD